MLRRSACRDEARDGHIVCLHRHAAGRYKLMTPERPMRIASSMFETARAVIESSLPLDLTRRERRLAFAKRLYAGELPDAALRAFAEWKG
jgi:hypothetical protein